MILIFCQDDWIPGDEIFVNALTDEPMNLLRPREDVAIKEVSPEPKVLSDTIHFTVEYWDINGDKSNLHCKMTKTKLFEKLINMYADTWDLDASEQRLTFNGETVFPSDTPASVSHRRLFLSGIKCSQPRRLV